MEFVGPLKPVLLPLAFAIALPAVSTAKAEGVECKIIETALLQMTMQPIFRQVDTRADFPVPIEMIFTQETNYVRSGGTWKQTPGSGAIRLAQLERSFNDDPLHDCALAGREELEGVETSRYEYTQAGSRSIAVRIWIGSKDRLPYQLQTGVTLSKIKYHNVSVPPIEK
jgi:hypothetical protein